MKTLRNGTQISKQRWYWDYKDSIVGRQTFIKKSVRKCQEYGGLKKLYA